MSDISQLSLLAPLLCIANTESVLKYNTDLLQRHTSSLRVAEVDENKPDEGKSGIEPKGP